MKGLRLLVRILCVTALIGTATYLPAQSTRATTTRPSSAADDIADAQQAMRKLLEQGPPITSPTLPGTGPVDAGEAIVPRKQRSGTGTPGPAYLPAPPPRIRGKLLPEGHYLADRRGRLTRLNDAWMFVFESDGRIMADPPLQLLPNRWLEKMEADVTASHDHESVIFRVSGEITAYHGQNYLLLRKVLIEREPQDNFK